MTENEYFIKGRLEHVYCCKSDGESIINKKYHGFSDNQCEWRAVVDMLTHIYTTYGDSGNLFLINMDSKLVFRQIMSKTAQNYNGRTYSIKSNSLHPIYLEWNKLKNTLWDTTINYIYVDGLDNIARKRLDNEHKRK